MKCHKCGKSFVFVDSETCLSCEEDNKSPDDWMYDEVKTKEREVTAE